MLSEMLDLLGEGNFSRRGSSVRKAIGRKELNDKLEPLPKISRTDLLKPFWQASKQLF